MSTTIQAAGGDRSTVTIYLNGGQAELTAQIIDEIEMHAVLVRIVDADQVLFAGHPADLIDLGITTEGLGGETAVERAIGIIAARGNDPLRAAL